MIKKNLLTMMLALSGTMLLSAPVYADTFEDVLVFEAAEDALESTEASGTEDSTAEDTGTETTNEDSDDSSASDAELTLLSNSGDTDVSALPMVQFLDVIEAEDFSITEESNENGTIFHVFTSDGKDQATVQETIVTTTASSGSKAAELVAYASQFIGNPYSYGGVSLTNGADCSGFMMTVYGHFGIELPHSSAAMVNVGTAVSSLDEAVPGDILVYSGHVGIYLGNGKMLSALNSKRGIAVESATYKSIKAIRRVLDTAVSV